MAETETTPEVTEEVPVVDPTQPPSKENELVYDFENYKQHFFENFVKIKDLKQFDDGSLVCLSETKRIRFPCSISAISIAIPKLNREFYQAKKKMMENGFMHNTIDLQLPDYRQPNSSSAETALKIIFQFVFKGEISVTERSIKNVAVLAAYLQMDSLLDALPLAAEQLNIADFDIISLKETAKSLGEITVVGLEKFVNVFGGGQKKKQNKNQAGQKRAANKNNGQAVKKDEPEQKKSRPLEEPNPNEGAYEIDSVPPEEMIAEEAAPEETAADQPVESEQEPESTESYEFHVSNNTEESSAENVESEASQEAPAEAEAEVEPAVQPAPAKAKPAPRGRKARRGRKAAN